MAGQGQSWTFSTTCCSRLRPMYRAEQSKGWRYVRRIIALPLMANKRGTAPKIHRWSPFSTQLTVFVLMGTHKSVDYGTSIENAFM